LPVCYRGGFSQGAHHPQSTRSGAEVPPRRRRAPHLGGADNGPTDKVPPILSAAKPDKQGATTRAVCLRGVSAVRVLLGFAARGVCYKRVRAGRAVSARALAGLCSLRAAAGRVL
jgi:hypothetical protein